MWWLAAAVIVALLPRTAAAQAGLINPLPIISHFESSNGTNTSCSATGACGIFQDVGSTWRSALRGIGINPAQFPTANDAPASVQIAANNYLLNTQGLQPWTCSGCDAAFTAYVNAHGGPSAFQTSGLSINPADFAQFDGDSAALLAFLNSGGADTASSGGGDTLTQAPSGPPSGAAPSASALPFEWVYNQVTNGIMGQITNSIDTVEAIASGPATALLALAIAIMGFMTMFGNMDMAVFLSFAIRAAIVMAFIQVGNSFYADWIQAFVIGLPDYFAGQFSLTGIGGTPGQLFDQIINGWWASVLAVWHASPWSIKGFLAPIALVAVTILIVIPSLVAMFTVFLISTFLLLVMLTIGPLMILALLFRTTYRFLHGYVNVLVTGAIFALVVDIVLGIFSSILTQVMGNFTPSGSPDTDVPGLFGLAITMLITGFTMARLPRLIEAIGGGVAVSLETAGRFAAGGFAADAGRSTAAAVARAV